MISQVTSRATIRNVDAQFHGVRRAGARCLLYSYAVSILIARRRKFTDLARLPPSLPPDEHGGVILPEGRSKPYPVTGRQAGHSITRRCLRAYLALPACPPVAVSYQRDGASAAPLPGIAASQYFTRHAWSEALSDLSRPALRYPIDFGARGCYSSAKGVASKATAAMPVIAATMDVTDTAIG